jgi:hypothetical protein
MGQSGRLEVTATQWQTDLIDTQSFLVSRGKRFEKGLSEKELQCAEQKCRAAFPPDLRWFLSQWLPVGGYFADWRRLPAYLDEQIGWPLEGILFDVTESKYWRAEWGSRPDVQSDAVRIATQHIRAAPPLIPIVEHCYLPSSPSQVGNPAFSVYQTDIIHAGSNLSNALRWLFRENPDPLDEDNPVYSESYTYAPFWTDLARENYE